MNEITLHRRAEKGLRGLSSIERRKALLAIDRISEGKWRDILKDRNLRQLRVTEGEKLYSYRSSPRIRLIIRHLEENRIQIEDIASHDTLRRYFNWRDE
jgi:mRNA-degrading endonuclease RelE of RelBE toxin-antitoxin system